MTGDWSVDGCLQLLRNLQVSVGYRDLPALAENKILDGLDSDGQLAFAGVCRSWNEAARNRRSQLRLKVRSRSCRGPPAFSVGAGELSAALQRFPHLTSLVLAKADERNLEWLPPLPELRALDLEGCVATALAPSLPGFTALTALSFTISHCSQLTGGQAFLELPLLEALSITCLAGDFIELLSSFPELPALRSLSAASFADEVKWKEHAGSFSWMQNLRSVAVRWAPPYGERSLEGRRREGQVQSPNIILPILGKCTSAEELRLCATCPSYLHGSSILAISELEKLRSLSLDMLEPLLSEAEAAEAWRALRQKVVGLSVSRMHKAPLELKWLQKLQKLDLLHLWDGREDILLLCYLADLRELSIGDQLLPHVKDLTRLQKLTQLTTSFALIHNIDNQLEGAGVIRALPNLKRLNLILRLNSRDNQRDLRNVAAFLDSAVSRSSVALHLKIHLWKRFPFFPLSFLERVEGSLVSLSLSARFSGRGRFINGWSRTPAMSNFYRSLSHLPSLGSLRQLQLLLDDSEADEWLRVLRPESLQSLSQLQYLCLVFDICREARLDLLEGVTQRVLETTASRLPGLREVCVHGELMNLENPASTGCSSCKANGMGDFKWLW